MTEIVALTPVEFEVLQTLRASFGRKTFTIAGAVSTVEKSSGATQSYLSRLTQAGALVRMGRGIYAVSAMPMPVVQVAPKKEPKEEPPVIAPPVEQAPSSKKAALDFLMEAERRRQRALAMLPTRIPEPSPAQRMRGR